MSLEVTPKSLTEPSSNNNNSMSSKISSWWNDRGRKTVELPTQYQERWEDLGISWKGDKTQALATAYLPKGWTFKEKIPDSKSITLYDQDGFPRVNVVFEGKIGKSAATAAFLDKITSQTLKERELQIQMEIIKQREL